MSDMKKFRFIRSRIVAVAVGGLLVGAMAGPPAANGLVDLYTNVIVKNTSANPVPVTGSITGTVSSTVTGTVNVGNLPDPGVPVGDSIRTNVDGYMTIPAGVLVTDFMIRQQSGPAVASCLPVTLLRSAEPKSIEVWHLTGPVPPSQEVSTSLNLTTGYLSTAEHPLEIRYIGNNFACMNEISWTGIKR